MSSSEENPPTIKVLHFIDSGGLYGAEKMLLALVSEQVNQGISPMILSAGELDEPEKALEAEAKKLGLPIKPWRMKPGFNLKSTRDIVSWAQAEGYTHFHSHGFKFNVLLALLSLVGLSQKLITTVHGYVGGKRFSKLWVYEVLDGLALWRFNKVVVVSEPMLEIPVIRRLPSKRIKVVGNGIAANYERAKLPADIAEFTAGYEKCLIAIGRLSYEKGFGYLIDVMADVSRQDKINDVGLVIVGEGGLREDLCAMIKSHGLTNVMMAGYREDAGLLLNSFDALVMPSLTEGMPITLLEAMRAVVPVCASRVGGIPSTLSEDSAYLIEPASKVSLKKAIVEILNSDGPSIRARNALEIFKNEGDAKIMGERYKRIYSE